MRRSALAVLLLAAALGAQENLVTNPDFSAPTLAPWRTVNEQWMQGLSWAGRGVTWGNFDETWQNHQRSVGLTQDIEVATGGPHLVQMFAQSHAITGRGPCLCRIGGRDYSFAMESRQHAAVVVELKPGKATLSLTFSQSNDDTDRWTLFAVAVRPVPATSCYWRTSFDFGGVVELHAIGGICVPMLSLQRLETGIRFPGIAGELQLDPWRDGGVIFLPPALGGEHEPVLRWLTMYMPWAHIPKQTLYAQVLQLTPMPALSNRDALLKFRP